MMGYGELTLPPERPTHNRVNGRFMKGHVPKNKGRKWSEYMPKRSQRRAMKGWKNLVTHRPKTRSDVAGRCRKPVIAILDDGRWAVFPYIGAAGDWVGGNRENVRRCCKENRRMHVNLKTGRINTDHRYMGVRFYYEEDEVWFSKIRRK